MIAVFPLYVCVVFTDNYKVSPHGSACVERPHICDRRCTPTHTFIPTQMEHVKVNPGRTFQVMFVHLHSSPWHPVFRGQGMSSNFECLVLVKRLFIPRAGTQMHTCPHTHTHTKPAQHMAHRSSLPCKALHLIGSQSLLRSLHAESPYTIKRTSKG